MKRSYEFPITIGVTPKWSTGAPGWTWVTLPHGGAARARTVEEGVQSVIEGLNSSLEDGVEWVIEMIEEGRA